MTASPWRLRALYAAKLLLLGALGGSAFLYWTYGEHRIAPVTEGVYYQSAAMPTDELEEFVRETGIRTVIDFRFRSAKTEAERAAMQAAGVRYVSLPTTQVPTDATLDAFRAILDDPANYPILGHCNHGEGRAPLFGALFRIEQEGWDPEIARRHAKALTFRGDFAPDGRKGRFLREYHRRHEPEPSR